jgi:hypothetical protein
MTIYVLSDPRLASIVEWQAAIDAEAFPLRFATDHPDGEPAGVAEESRVRIWVKPSMPDSVIIGFE